MSNEADSKRQNSQERVSMDVSATAIQTTYSNFARGVMTEEEVLLDFGFNPNAVGKILDEPAVLTNRIILSIPSAIRLHQLLQSMLLRRQQAVEASRKPVSPQGESGSPGAE